jgi:hypothetical protein
MHGIWLANTAATLEGYSVHRLPGRDRFCDVEGATPNKLSDTRDRAVEQSGERRLTPTEGDNRFNPAKLSGTRDRWGEAIDSRSSSSTGKP